MPGSGPKAGGNFAKTKLERCDHSAQQNWVPSQWDTRRSNETWLIDYAHPDYCLDVDKRGGLVSGHAIQLFECHSLDAANEGWDIGDLRAQTELGKPWPLCLSEEPLCISTRRDGTLVSGKAPNDIAGYWSE